VSEYANLTYDEKAKIVQDAKQRIEDLESLIDEDKAIIKEVSTILEADLVADGVRSVATEHGTIHTVSRTTARVLDPQATQDFVIKGNNPGAINWAANPLWCRKYAEEYGAPVPGVELSTIRQLRITAPKPTKKVSDE
jgi:hypothetical protein